MMNHSFEATLAQVQGLRTDLQLTKRKVLLEMFVSSFAAILFVLPLLWMLLQTSLQFRTGLFGFTPAILVFPLLINATMWTAWIGIQTFQSSRSFEGDIGGTYGDDDLRSLYIEYEWLRYSFFRARQMERMIDVLTALEFMTISVTLAFLVITASKLM